MDQETKQQIKIKNDKIHNLEISMEHYAHEAAVLNMLAGHAIEDAKLALDSKLTDDERSNRLYTTIALVEKMQSITEMYR
jgi:hypothetical protein